MAKSENFPKVFHRGKSYWSKRHIDAYFAKKAADESITEWYSVADMKEKFHMTTTAVYTFVSNFKIPKKRTGKEVFYSKRHVDIAKGVAEPEAPQYYGRTRYYYDHVYIKVFDIIRNIETISEDKPLVVFINNCIYDWSKDTYDFHYRYLKSVLEQNQYTYTDIDNLYKLAKEQIFSCVMIIDFITTNKELSTNCNLILDYFKDNTPVIGYHSIIKEYSEKEILDLIEQENTDKDNEQNSIQYVKTLFLKVNKNDYFLYFAIINVLIGQANCSDEIKKTWLRNPDAIYVDGDSKDGIIKFTYSINGNDKQTFSMKGDGNSINDVS